MQKGLEGLRTRAYSGSEIYEKSLEVAFGPAFRTLAGPYLILLALLLVPEQIMAARAWQNFIENPELVTLDLPKFPYVDCAPGLKSVLWLMPLTYLVNVILMHYVWLRARTVVTGEPEPFLVTARRTLDPIRLASLILSGLVAGLAILLGAVVFLLPGVALSVQFALLPAAVVAGEKRFHFPFAQTLATVRGRFWRTAGVLAMNAAAFGVLSLLVTIPAFLAAPKLHRAMTPQDASRLIQELAEWGASPLAIGVGLASDIIQVLSLVVIAVATTIMFVNYNAVPCEAEPSESQRAHRAREDLRDIFDQEQLAERQDLADVAGRLDYSSYTDSSLVDSYRHIKREEHPDTLRALLAEIRRRAARGDGAS
ncbi:MAG: hypothetical protein KC591_12525 [Gemmatimonadetes bacterium]|nr:hypothetical protein [Gemmatimonadota bacterium]